MFVFDGTDRASASSLRLSIVPSRADPYTFLGVVFDPDLVARVFQILLIDLVLSGDNAVVIGLAAHPLPPRQRRMAILFGGAAALGLRIALTAGAALLLGLPALKAIGGALLLWIAYRLLEGDQNVERPANVATTLRGAIATILLADVVMSLDNVLGVAAASNNDVALLLFGLALSMAIVMLGGSIIAEAIDRLWWLAYSGALVIAWTGADMIQEDSLVTAVVDLPSAGRWAACAVVSVCVVGLAHRAHRRSPVLQRSAR